MTRLLGVLALLLVILAAAPVGAAADSAVKLQAVAGFGGRAKGDTWIPLEVTIQNDGPELKGVVRVEVEASMNSPGRHMGYYEVPVAVPAGGAKRLQMELPGDLLGAAQVKLVAGGQEVAVASYQLETTVDLLVGVLGVEPAELPGLAGKTVRGRQLRLVGLDPERLPSDPLLFKSLDAILLDRFSYSELPEVKRQAIQAWVEQGGQLIAAAGPEAKRLDGLAPWVSLPLKGLQTVQVAGIGAAPLSQAEAAGGWQVAQQIGGQVLALRQGKGAGTVHLLTFDPALEPFASWHGLPDLLAPIFPGEAQIAPGGVPRGNLALVDGLNQFPMRELPSSKRLLILLGLYALVIGPVHFLLLRAFRRVGWAVLTLPVLIATGGLGVWAYTKSAHASDLMVSSVAVLEGQPGAGSLRVSMMAGFFSPPGSSHRVTLGDALMQPVAPMFMGRPDAPGSAIDLKTTFEQGRLAVLGVKQEWGMHVVSAESIVPVQGTVEGELTAGARRMTGRLTSHLPFKLEGAVVASGTNFIKIGDLAPGETIGVELMTPAFAQQFGGDNPLAEVLAQATQFMGGGPDMTAEQYELMRRQQVGWAAISTVSWARSGQEPPAVLMGWTNQPPLPVTVDGRTVETPAVALYVQPLPVGIATGEFALPASMIPGRMVSGVPTGVPLRQGWNMPKGDSAVIEFDVPAQVVGRVSELEVKIPAMGGLPDGKHPLEYSIYRWADGTWQQAVDGQPVKSGGFIGPTGTVRIKAVQVAAERIPLGRPGLAVSGRGVKP
ncbi:MAG TPA: hypothetical protein VNT75_16780 [Symbiobacteriaceae bacterium]|nr:hypothetical protein [Symbiobacteriaceae bacterium]